MYALVPHSVWKSSCHRAMSPPVFRTTKGAVCSTCHHTAHHSVALELAFTGGESSVVHVCWPGKSCTACRGRSCTHPQLNLRVPQLRHLRQTVLALFRRSVRHSAELKHRWKETKQVPCCCWHRPITVDSLIHAGVRRSRTLAARGGHHHHEKRVASRAHSQARSKWMATCSSYSCSAASATFSGRSCCTIRRHRGCQRRCANLDRIAGCQLFVRGVAFTVASAALELLRTVVNRIR